jgi:hypothetical protein
LSVKKFSLRPQLSIRDADIWSTFYGAPVTATDKIGRNSSRISTENGKVAKEITRLAPFGHETDRHPRYEPSINVNFNQSRNELK